MLTDAEVDTDRVDDDENLPLLDFTIVNTPVYPILHLIRTARIDIEHFIDTPLTYDALTGPDLTYSLVKPLTDKYHALQRAGNKAVVFCLLLNRAHLMRDTSIMTAAVSRSRATLCEILATGLLQEWESVLDLAAVTTIPWPIFNGADAEVLERADLINETLTQERVGNALEMAIVSKAKRFIKSRACQRVIDHIWSGKCVYTAESQHSIISDTYKRVPIRMYDPHKAPLLDHYRLKVPAVRSVLEYWNFLLLFVLFVMALENSRVETLTTAEMVFLVYAFGFSLEKVATMQEHGLHVYVTGTWNGFDLAFVTLYVLYASMRLHGVLNNHAWAREAGLDVLALAAVFIFPRLAFVTLSNNLLVLSLRSMFVEFFNLMFIAGFIFGGFLYALWTLSRGTGKFEYSPVDITWWMLDLWFGLDATGFQLSANFHPIFGPALFVIYAMLSNTLLLTVLVSILSHTFANISADAEQEAMFRRAVATIEGVKADALFSYLPPINIVALGFLVPISYILSPRWLHKVNVAFIRIANLPILLFIAFYERQAMDMSSVGFYETVTTTAERIYDSLPRRIKRLTLVEGLVGGGPDIDAVFEIEEELESEDAARTSKHLSPTQRAQQATSVILGAQNGSPKLEVDDSALSTSETTPDAGVEAPFDDPMETPRFERPHPPALSLPTLPRPTIVASPSSSPGRSDAATSLHMSPISQHQPPFLASRPRRRSRLLSQMARPADFMAPPVPQSPLTQIYQPLIVDVDPFAAEHEPDIPEEGPLDGLQVPPGGIPGGRRRLSMHRRNITEPMGIAPLTGMPLQRRPTVAGLGHSHPPHSQLHVHPGTSHPSDAPPTASSVPFSESPQAETSMWRRSDYDRRMSRGDFSEAGDATSGGPDAPSYQITDRLRAIEERQARIEELLLKMAGLLGEPSAK
ncbi:hypothetical protein BKA62DRAFT_826183 [Auriculariales sp. MPI-PUGE-AT-0066]|nr:hypothetical protein BKA62DRAFT_826183 [Auriculariales sp. MPI-PUGE-AT-0066]